MKYQITCIVPKDKREKVEIALTDWTGAAEFMKNGNNYGIFRTTFKQEAADICFELAMLDIIFNFNCYE